MGFTDHGYKRVRPQSVAAPVERSAAEAEAGRPARYAWASLRMVLGAIFLWAFLDKLLGLGFATAADKAWINGGSPTFGFLKFGVDGPLAPMYQAMAGNVFVDWLFMMGLLLIGGALLLGIGMKVAAASGALLMLLMYAAALPPQNHPFLDEHIVYAIALLGLGFSKAGRDLGLGGWWSRQEVVKRYPILE